jgi:hypothetical protein
MELTFGIVFLVLLIASTMYAIGRTIYEKWINPPRIVEENPAVIPFHTATRLAAKIARDRVIAEAPTTVIVLPRNADGDLMAPEQHHRNPGASTVDMKGNTPAGRHRTIRPYTGNNPHTGTARVASAEAAA